MHSVSVFNGLGFDHTEPEHASDTAPSGQHARHSEVPLRSLQGMDGPLPVDVIEEQLKPAPTKATSCLACRKAKTRCAGSKPGAPPYPCSRCVRLGLKCEDPHEGSSKDDSSSSKITDLGRAVIKRLEADPSIPRELVERLLGVTSLIYRRRFIRSKGVSTLLDSLDGMLRALVSFLGGDEEAFFRELRATGNEALEGVTVDGIYMTHLNPRESIHPYCAHLYDESRATIALVTIRGEHRLLCNEMFSKHWFDTEHANFWHLENELPAPVIMAIPIHSTERTRLIKTMTDLLLFSPPKGEEVRQIFKVRLIKLKVSVMALLRMRFYLYGRGDYLCATFALTPIPMHAAPARRIPQGSRRTVLHVPAEADEWVETAHVYGEWEDPCPASPSTLSASSIPSIPPSPSYSGSESAPSLSHLPDHDASYLSSQPDAAHLEPVLPVRVVPVPPEPTPVLPESCLYARSQAYFPPPPPPPAARVTQAEYRAWQQPQPQQEDDDDDEPGPLVLERHNTSSLLLPEDLELLSEILWDPMDIDDEQFEPTTYYDQTV